MRSAHPGWSVYNLIGTWLRRWKVAARARKARLKNCEALLRTKFR
jgi:hypothetical protein